MSDVWDRRGMQLAQVAAGWSKDDREQVGAAVVSPDHRQFSLGCNGRPSGFPDDAVLDRQTKNRYSLHAEDNAIANAATDLHGWTVYTTKAPCLHCAMALHRAGVKRVVSPPLDPQSQWHAEQKEAEEFLSAMGIKQTRLEPITGPTG